MSDSQLKCGISVLTHMNYVLPHKNSQKKKKKFILFFLKRPQKMCVLSHKFSKMLWFYHTFSVVIIHKNNVLPHKKYLFLIYKILYTKFL
jgi:hypothetical protein